MAIITSYPTVVPKTIDRLIISQAYDIDADEPIVGNPTGSVTVGSIVDLVNTGLIPGTGTVTSVGVSMPSAFTVSNSPITSAGVINITGSGTSVQYIDGTGALQDSELILNRNSTSSTSGYKVIPSDFDWSSDLSGLSNTILEIRHSFDLLTQNITLPAFSTIKYNGGVFSNGSITGTSSYIDCPLEQKFFETDCNVSLGFTNSVCSPVWFGAVADVNTSTGAGTDNTAAFNKAVYFFSKSSPPYLSGWGQGKVFIPKGVYLVNGTIGVPASGSNAIIGLIFEGAGQETTTIVTNTDSSVMFDLLININFKVRDISFTHFTSSASSSWTNILFDLDGLGGGRNFNMENVSTRNFGRVVKHTGLVNQDTFMARSCVFQDCYIFLESGNSQGVVNNISECTFVGAIFKAFSIAGFSKTTFRNINCVIDGTFLFLENIASKFGRGSSYHIENLKMEWTTANQTASTIPKLFSAIGEFILGRIEIVGGGITGGPTPHADAVLFSYASPVKVTFDMGSFEGKPLLQPITGLLPVRMGGIDFTNMDIVSPDTWIYDGSAVSGKVYPNIIFNSCTDNVKRVTDMVFNNNSKSQLLSDNSFNYNFGPNTASSSIGFDDVGLIDYSAPFYGQETLLESVDVLLYSKGGSLASEIKVFSDAAKTTLLGTVSTPATHSVSSNTLIIPFNLTPLILKEGVFIEVNKEAASSIRISFLAKFKTL